MLSFTLEHMLDKVSGPTWPIFVAIMLQTHKGKSIKVSRLVDHL